MAVTIAILRYVRLADKAGWTRVGVKRDKRGEKLTLKPGEVVTHRGGYQLRWYEDRKAKFVAAGDTLEEAEASQTRQLNKFAAPEVAKAADGKFVPNDPGRLTLIQQRDDFIKLKKGANRDAETISSYEQLIDRFLAVTHRTYASEITEADVLIFYDDLRSRGFKSKEGKAPKGLSERSVYNYAGSIGTFLRSCGVEVSTLVKSHLTKEEDNPVAYSKEQLKSFMAAVTGERDRLFFLYMLRTGCRELEVSHLVWEWLDFEHKVVNIPGTKEILVNVDDKPVTIHFRTKTRKSRSIPLEQGLMQELKLWEQKVPGSRFVFGRQKVDLPDSHMLRTCKEIAYKAGLNCGRCQSCIKTKGQECQEWFLHRFRSSFATWALRGGANVRDVQAWLGHTKLEVTSRYLAAAEGPRAQDAINLACVEL